MKVVFLSPQFPMEMPEFTRGLAEVGAQVHGVGQSPAASLPQSIRPYLSSYTQVKSLDDVSAALPALRRIKPDRVECLWEVGVLAAAHLRKELGVAGMSPEDALAFRDKTLMKQRLQKAGLRVPHNARATTAAEVQIGRAHV